MKILFIILTFLIQPAFWIGLIRSFFNYSSRLKKTRRDFNVSIYEHNYETNHFLIGTFILGILISLVSWILEITISFNWIMLYEFLLALSLIIIPGGVLPVTILIAASLGWLEIGFMNGLKSLTLVQNYVLLAGIVLISLGIFILVNGGRFKIPRAYRNERDNLVAGYPFKELAITPVLVMIPGASVQRLLPMYPTFEIGGHSISLFLLPILVGLRFTVFKHLTKVVFKRMGVAFCALGVVSVVLSLVQQSIVIDVIILFALLVLTWLILGLTKHFDLNHGHWFSQPVNGVRVVGIEPHTPASRLDLEVGDVVLDVNHRPVRNEDEFYEALQSEPTYCRLRVLNLNDRLKLTSTAIFNDAPHEIGIVLFKRG